MRFQTPRGSNCQLVWVGESERAVVDGPHVEFNFMHQSELGRGGQSRTRLSNAPEICGNSFAARATRTLSRAADRSARLHHTRCGVKDTTEIRLTHGLSRAPLTTHGSSSSGVKVSSTSGNSSPAAGGVIAASTCNNHLRRSGSRISRHRLFGWWPPDPAARIPWECGPPGSAHCETT